MKRTKYCHKATLLQLLEAAASTSIGIPITSMRKDIQGSKKLHSYIDDEAQNEECWSKTVQIVRSRLLDVIGPEGIFLTVQPYPSIKVLGQEIRTAITAYALRYGFHRSKEYSKDLPFGEILIDALVKAAFCNIEDPLENFTMNALGYAVDVYFGRLRTYAETDSARYTALVYEMSCANKFFQAHHENVLSQVLLEEPSDYLEQASDDDLYEALAEYSEQQSYAPIAHRDFLRIRTQIEIAES